MQRLSTGIGARGRNRTGTPCGEGFSSHFGFRRQRGRCSWSGARLHHSLAAVGARRLLSTPSRPCGRAWLGVGSDTRDPGRSPTLTGVTSGVSPRRLKFSSPLCLPISPLGRERCVWIPVAAARGKPDIVVAAHRGCKLRLRSKGGTRTRRAPQTSRERKVTTLLRLVTMSCAPLHLEISEPLQYQLREIPL